jgi:hypothetical protein
MNKRTNRQQTIFQALVELGGKATAREIARRTGLNANGVSQTLSQSDFFKRRTQYLRGDGGEFISEIVSLPDAKPPERDLQLELEGIK